MCKGISRLSLSGEAGSHETTPFFYAAPADVARDEEFYQLKAIFYFHLNVFEEIFLTTEGAGGLIAEQFERAGWNQYIFRKMRQPLMREVFDREAEQIYPGAFTKFIRNNWEQIQKPPPQGPFCVIHRRNAPCLA